MTILQVLYVLHYNLFDILEYIPPTDKKKKLTVK